MRLGNTEWFRNSPSPLERTLRRPILYREIIRLFLVRFLPLWFFCTWALQWIFGFGPRGTSIAGFSVALVIEMFWLRWWCERFWIPAHLLRIASLKRLVIKREEMTTKELVDAIERSVRSSTRGLVEIGYVGFPAWGWEIVFRAIYPLLVRLLRPPYHELLIGLPNKTVEGDQMLWDIANPSSRSRLWREWRSQIAASKTPRNDQKPGRNVSTEGFIEKFGSKVDDVDLAFPTLAEKPKIIASMITLYRNSPSPFSLLQKAASRREKATKDVLKRVRIPGALFKKLLVLVQQNVQLREDRRHYEFLGDYPIRLMLLKLARLLGKSEKEFFQMEWHEIKNAATNH